ncbi:efflux RND transporter periplasmic adaptor subunit [Jannaschia sp. LMIT008]|uniref:efflux RND transporter periplasmic adaptor subunit n=1 Tax=Jannaschia maritima TaxID=3032585 RepID=UPI0028121A03|nr:efflux RND transporter periplasmic adaptor subunit [Jannaschia sp. LMIT008]
MRVLPVLTAMIVCVALFFVVLQRERLLGFVGSVTGEADAAPERTGDSDAAVPSGPVSIAVSGEAAPDPVNVLVRNSVARQVDDAVLVRGQTEAAREVTVAAETSGTIVSEPIRKGAFVEAGQLLCELDAGSRLAQLSEAEARLAEARSRVPEAEARGPEAQARISEAQARLEEARINQNAATRLSEEGFAAQTRVAGADAALRAAEASVTAAETGLSTVQSGIESALAGIQSAEASVENARLEIAKLTIEAPFDGLLETDTAELGALLQPGSPCATVVQLDPLKLVGFLSEAQVSRVAVGSEVGAHLASGQRVAGQVTFLSRSADETTRTFRVEATVPNPDLTLRDGQTVEMVIRTDPIQAHMLPASALTLNDEGVLGLRVVEDGLATFAPVQLIRDTANGVLLAGLPDAAAVITVGQEYVTDGVPVRAVPDDETAEATR